MESVLGGSQDMLPLVLNLPRFAMTLDSPPSSGGSHQCSLRMASRSNNLVTQESALILHLFFVFFYRLCFGIISEKTLYNPESKNFSSRNDIGLSFTFRSIIHTELILSHKVWIINIYIYTHTHISLDLIPLKIIYRHTSFIVLCFIVLHSYCTFTNQRFVATLCTGNLSGSFSQQHLLSLCLCVTF